MIGYCTLTRNRRCIFLLLTPTSVAPIRLSSHYEDENLFALLASVSSTIMCPGLPRAAFRALVEENVKSNVKKIAESAVMQDHYAYVLATNGPGPTSPPSTFEPSSLLPPAPPQPAPTTSTAATNANDTRPGSATEIFVHGWVYDVETGRVCDLGVTVGPPGRDVPVSPFPRVGEE
ncbi:hypothetical protein D9619_004045 [Psilocybe cf. subviscida]|uniref:Carbonic anhydrase n=1 Tax=Psilocybe cf. subviscida TaxID=2480587 RepID=A0A8H5BR56_9AGAR|nr:hypothetical protein D9619_004045 [Psilocybe cf. subviscida]